MIEAGPSVIKFPRDNGFTYNRSLNCHHTISKTILKLCTPPPQKKQTSNYVGGCEACHCLESSKCSGAFGLAKLWLLSKGEPTYL